MVKLDLIVHQNFRIFLLNHKLNFIKPYDETADSLMRDHETKKGIDSLSTSCLQQLNSVQEKHGGSISKILNSAQKCLTEDYLVGLAYFEINSFFSSFKFMIIFLVIFPY